MSAHDRGAFGELLARAKAAGAKGVVFDVNLYAADEDAKRWCASTQTLGGEGRTGEEALRALVDKLEAPR